MKNCYIIDFNSIGDEQRGYLVSLEANKNIPFSVKRVYYTYGVPTDAKRGFHAHKNLEQVLVCTSGSLKVKCFDGKNEKIYSLDNPSKGLYMSNAIWREIYDYSENTVLMVLASELYDESDYIRNYDDFLEINSKVKITTENIVELVEYDREYLDLSWKWLNDKEIKSSTMTPDITRKEQLNWFSTLKNKSDYIIFGIKYNGKKIGAAGLKNITENSAEYWGYIGEKKYWGRKIGDIVIDNIIEIAKNYEIKKLWLKVKKDNERATRLYKSKGFKEKSIDKDIIIMDMNILCSKEG